MVLFSFPGAFLIPYFLAMLTCGIPLFLLEVSVGQYLGVGGMSVVGQLCPIFKGVGYSALMMVFLENVYYIIIVAWTLFYILNTFYNITDELPWAGCHKGGETHLVSRNRQYSTCHIFFRTTKLKHIIFSSWKLGNRRLLRPNDRIL